MMNERISRLKISAATGGSGGVGGKVRFFQPIVPPPSPTPTSTSIPVVTPTATSIPVVTPTATSTPFVTPTATSIPVVTPTATSTPFVTPTATSTPFVTPTATSTPFVTPTALVSTFNVTNNGTGNYVINGSSNPTLTLTEGQTYIFNIDAPGHPFWIKTTQTTGTSDAYNTGVTNNGTANGEITFVVPFGAPSTLYYNCEYHSSMAGVINIVSSPTPTPTASSATVTSTPTPTPTASSTPAVTPSATVTSTPTPTPTASSTPAVTPSGV